VRLTVRVPATSANLGPGFDCFGLALDLWNEVTIDTEAEPGVRWEGEGAEELPVDGSDMVSRAIRSAAGAEGDLPPFALRGTNRIPLERGLGSSAGAAVAGAALGRALLGRLEDPHATFTIAAGLEGHPDNAAAAVYGGLTLASVPVPVRLEPHPSLRPVALVPEAVRMSTEQARFALADVVPRADAVFNLAHAALAVVALTSRPDLLSEAVMDRLHQDARLDLMPPVRAVFERLRDAGLPVCVSGAGPSLLALRTDETRVPHPGVGWRVLELDVSGSGAVLREA
jgi:homoserine kinase